MGVACSAPATHLPIKDIHNVGETAKNAWPKIDWKSIDLDAEWRGNPYYMFCQVFLKRYKDRLAERDKNYDIRIQIPKFLCDKGVQYALLIRPLNVTSGNITLNALGEITFSETDIRGQHSVEDFYQYLINDAKGQEPTFVQDCEQVRKYMNLNASYHVREESPTQVQ